MAEEKEKKTVASCQCDAKDVEENKVLAAIGYVGILFLIPLLAKKDSPYAQFHAKQGMALFVVGVAIWIIMMIPVLGWIIGFLGWLVFVILFIMGLANSLGGKCVKLPVIGGWFKNIKV